MKRTPLAGIVESALDARSTIVPRPLSRFEEPPNVRFDDDAVSGESTWRSRFTGTPTDPDEFTGVARLLRTFGLDTLATGLPLDHDLGAFDVLGDDAPTFNASTPPALHSHGARGSASKDGLHAAETEHAITPTPSVDTAHVREQAESDGRFVPATDAPTGRELGMHTLGPVHTDETEAHEGDAEPRQRAHEYRSDVPSTNEARVAERTDSPFERVAADSAHADKRNRSIEERPGETQPYVDADHTRSGADRTSAPSTRFTVADAAGRESVPRPTNGEPVEVNPSNDAPAEQVDKTLMFSRMTSRLPTLDVRPARESLDASIAGMDEPVVATTAVPFAHELSRRVEAQRVDNGNIPAFDVPPPPTFTPARETSHAPIPDARVVRPSFDASVVGIDARSVSTPQREIHGNRASAPPSLAQSSPLAGRPSMQTAPADERGPGTTFGFDNPSHDAQTESSEDSAELASPLPFTLTPDSRAARATSDASVAGLDTFADTNPFAHEHSIPDTLATASSPRAVDSDRASAPPSLTQSSALAGRPSMQAEPAKTLETRAARAFSDARVAGLDTFADTSPFAHEHPIPDTLATASSLRAIDGDRASAPPSFTQSSALAGRPSMQAAPADERGPERAAGLDHPSHDARAELSKDRTDLTSPIPLSLRPETRTARALADESVAGFDASADTNPFAHEPSIPVTLATASLPQHAVDGDRASAPSSLAPSSALAGRPSMQSTPPDERGREPAVGFKNPSNGAQNEPSNDDADLASAIPFTLTHGTRAARASSEASVAGIDANAEPNPFADTDPFAHEPSIADTFATTSTPQRAFDGDRASARPSLAQFSAVASRPSMQSTPADEREPGPTAGSDPSHDAHDAQAKPSKGDADLASAIPFTLTHNTSVTRAFPDASIAGIEEQPMPDALAAASALQRAADGNRGSALPSLAQSSALAGWPSMQSTPAYERGTGPAVGSDPSHDAHFSLTPDTRAARASAPANESERVPRPPNGEPIAGHPSQPMETQRGEREDIPVFDIVPTAFHPQAQNSDDLASPMPADDSRYGERRVAPPPQAVIGDTQAAPFDVMDPPARTFGDDSAHDGRTPSPADIARPLVLADTTDHRESRPAKLVPVSSDWPDRPGSAAADASLGSGHTPDAQRGSHEYVVSSGRDALPLFDAKPEPAHHEVGGAASESPSAFAKPVRAAAFFPGKPGFDGVTSGARFAHLDTADNDDPFLTPAATMAAPTSYQDPSAEQRSTPASAPQRSTPTSASTRSNAPVPIRIAIERIEITAAPKAAQPTPKRARPTTTLDTYRAGDA